MNKKYTYLLFLLFLVLTFCSVIAFTSNQKINIMNECKNEVIKKFKTFSKIRAKIAYIQCIDTFLNRKTHDQFQYD